MFTRETLTKVVWEVLPIWFHLFCLSVGDHYSIITAINVASLQCQNLEKKKLCIISCMTFRHLASSIPLKENSHRRTRIWSHNSSICERRWSRLLCVPVSDTFTRKKKQNKNDNKPVTKTHSTSTVSKELGPQIRCAVRTYSFKDRLSPPASDLIRQCDAVPTGSERAPSKTNSGQWHGPPPPSFKHPQGPPHVRRTATAPLQGGRADCGTPAMQHFKRQRTPIHIRRLYATSESFKTHPLVGIY